MTFLPIFALRPGSTTFSGCCRAIIQSSERGHACCTGILLMASPRRPWLLSPSPGTSFPSRRRSADSRQHPDHGLKESPKSGSHTGKANSFAASQEPFGLLVPHKSSRNESIRRGSLVTRLWLRFPVTGPNPNRVRKVKPRETPRPRRSASDRCKPLALPRSS